MVILVSEEIARWVLREGERSPAFVFESFPPHYCKLCTKPVERSAQKAHVKEHHAELQRLQRERRAEALRLAREANRARARI